VAGISGAKNVIIIMDASRSMEEHAGINSRLLVAKDAIKLVIKDLNNFDWVGFVYFNSDVYSYKDLMVEATAENIASLLKFIDET
jgi:von Willebrand factor type A domain